MILALLFLGFFLLFSLIFSRITLSGIMAAYFCSIFLCEASLGLGSKMFSKRYRGTLYLLRSIPLCIGVFKLARRLPARAVPLGKKVRIHLNHRGEVEELYGYDGDKKEIPNAKSDQNDVTGILRSMEEISDQWVLSFQPEGTTGETDVERYPIAVGARLYGENGKVPTYVVVPSRHCLRDDHLYPMAFVLCFIFFEFAIFAFLFFLICHKINGTHIIKR
ncbi:hypothetical protein [Pasteuria penetrans]|uniref:hypothetical protein n=1 Tax=Pasteuria penetrans TaxID=86005 RepID=UPI0011EEF481|nr:hypothetical protein [Pasteuria penetrans]